MTILGRTILRTNDRRIGQLKPETNETRFAWLNPDVVHPICRADCSYLKSDYQHRIQATFVGLSHYRYRTAGARAPFHQQVPPALIHAAKFHDAAPLTCRKNTGSIENTGVEAIKPMWARPPWLPLIHVYAVLGKKSAKAENSYVTDPYPSYLDRYIVIVNASHM